MNDADVKDVAAAVREDLRRGESCELLYPASVPAMRLVFVPVDPIRSVGDWTQVTGVVESAFPPEVRDASLEDATLVAWLGVGSAVMRVGGDSSPEPSLPELRASFPGADVPALAAFAALIRAINHDPWAGPKAAEARALAPATVNRIELRRPFGRASLFVDRDSVDIGRSLRVANHSPTGFAWGYGGSGPAQTALAILLHVTGDEELALKWHQAFKFEVIGGLSQDEDHQFDLDVRAWVARQEAAAA